MRKTTKLITGATIAALMLAALGYILPGHRSSGVKYTTEPAGRGDIQSAVTATGTVNAVTMVLVGTQVSGTIKEIYADFNSPVQKGQLIALIDPATIEAQVAQARANLLAARANLTKGQASTLDARRIMERDRQLAAKNYLAQNEADTAQTNYEVAESQEEAATAQVAQARAALRIAETNLGYTRITSPVTGIVVSRNVDVGQTVAASFQTPTLFTIAQDLTKMQINTSVDEADIGRVAVNQPAEFSVDAYPERTFHGEVWQVRISPVSIQNVVTYDVVIKVDNPELLLKPGMTANVSIIAAEKKGVLRVPNAAIRFRPHKEEKGPAARGEGKQATGSGVWVLEDGKPRRLGVSLGISDGAYTEIIAGELREGQQIIVDSTEKAAKAAAPPAAGPRFF